MKIKNEEKKKKNRTLVACIQMYPQDACTMKNFHIQSVLLAQNLQPAQKFVRLIKVILESTISIQAFYYTFPRKFLSINIFADLISRWI